MPAFLGQHLILDLDGRRTRFLEPPDSVHHIEGLAEACIAVYEERETCRPNDLTREEQDVVQCQDAEIGQRRGNEHLR